MTRDAVIAGDAFVTLDPYTAQRGPKLVARAATADSRRNLETLDAIAETGAGTVLTGTAIGGPRANAGHVRQVRPDSGDARAGARHARLPGPPA